MATNYNAKYKRFNGVDWDAFYFETTIEQVQGLQDILNGLTGSTFEALSDTLFTSLAAGQMTAYDTVSSKWLNTPNLVWDFSNSILNITGTITTSGNITSGGQVLVKTNDSRLSDARPASDVYSWAKAATKPTYAASEIGTLDATHRWLTDAYISTWNAKEPAITKGTTAQYFRGDMSLATMPTTLPASDVYAWAKAASLAASSVPNLDASKITSGTIDVARLPAIAIADIYEVASQAAQLALVAQKGDVAVRTDENKTYIHNGGTAGTIADWTLLRTPTDVVTSVAGKTGVVTLVKGDVGLGNVANVDTTNPINITWTASYRTVTDTEKGTWNGKQNALTAGNGISISGNVISADGVITVEEWITATKTLALSDANKLFLCSHTADQTLTIPTNASVPFPIGTMITFLLTGTHKVTFTGESGVGIMSMDDLVELKTQYGMASLIKVFENTWQLVGALE